MDNPTEYYCARKNKWKPTNKTSTNNRVAKTGRALRQAKHVGKHCSTTKLTKINLIGRLLVYNKKIFVSTPVNVVLNK